VSKASMPFHAEIPPVEIAASPAQVREVVWSLPRSDSEHPELTGEKVLDFAGMPSWHTAHFKSITVATPAGKKPTELVAGDKLAVSLNSLPLNFSPTIIVRSPYCSSLRSIPSRCPR
jgi:hypothetical protein